MIHIGKLPRAGETGIYSEVKSKALGFIAGIMQRDHEYALKPGTALRG